MTGIAKIDAPASSGSVPVQAGHAALALWLDPVGGVLPRLKAAMEARSAHPARTVVLLPYAQLRPLATRLWMQAYTDGFAPRFETTMNWSSSLGAFVPGGVDITYDAALDGLTAQALLAQAGLAGQQDALAGLLVQAAHQLGPLAAAHAPMERPAWAQNARRDALLGMDAPALALEAAVARIAVEWAAASRYATDILFTAEVRDALDCLVVVQGLSVDPMVAGLQRHLGDKLCCLGLAPEGLAQDAIPDAAAILLHACNDAEDEAQRATACALQHIAAGRFPLALVSSDRALTRRVRSMLEGARVTMRDENGWKLSTTRAAAEVMALLRAGIWNASTDAVLNWLKCAPAFADGLDALEALVRRLQLRDWREVTGAPALQDMQPQQALCVLVAQLRRTFEGRHTLSGWLTVLRTGLQSAGQWVVLENDAAGAKVLAALRLSEDAPAWAALAGNALWSARRLDLAEFTAWVNQALEAASFQPEYPLQEQVVILPMSQMLGRPFAAVVLAGCDEVRLNPSPEPPGNWTPAQRAALGLPTREALQALSLAAWQLALQSPRCDVLWRTGDDAGETLLPSALVQSLQLALGDPPGAPDPRADRVLEPAPVRPPLPTGEQVPVRRLSQGAYEDLRNCPYRFFALRQLGLKAADELDSEVDKRDFGLWLHEVLKRFHEALVGQPATERAQRVVMLEAAASATTQSMALADGEFLPFAAAWPAVRDGYLDWLVRHEATGAVFTEAESSHTQPLGDITLVGRIDRVDTLPDGTVLVVDYKTEPSAKTASRVREPLEDTQMAFYAALLPQDTLQGMYVNVGERDATRSYPQPDVVDARDALLEGIVQDMQRIREGATLPALGEGNACDYCQARGLCRKDFWTPA